jgi:hypothetical protein
MTISTVDEAHHELKKYITEGLFDFTNKYAATGSDLYPHVLAIMKSCLMETLEEISFQMGGKRDPVFTREQSDHICYQIGEWYLNWRDNLMNWEQRTHRLGYAKEELKMMICGNKDEV